MKFFILVSLYKVLLTLVNWINKLQEIVESSGKTGTNFRMGNYSNTFTRILFLSKSKHLQDYHRNSCYYYFYKKLSNESPWIYTHQEL